MSTKTASLALLLVALAAPGCPSPSGGGGAQIDGPAAHRLVAEGATLVDVRTPEEFASGHLEGARNIPVDQIAERAAELPRAKTVIVYCASGSRSAMAAATLARAGFTVRDLGTLEAWGR